jgi:hypothetical protein
VSLGQLIGPALGGLVLSADTAGSLEGATTRAFLVAAGLSILALPACWGTSTGGERGGRRRPDGQPMSARDIVRAPGVPAGMFASVAILAAVDIVTAYLPVIGERLGIGPAVVGTLLSLRAVASILSRLLIPWMVRALGRVRLIAVSAVGSALAMAALPVPNGAVGLAAVLVVAGFFLGIGQPLTMSLIVQAVPNDARGTALAIRPSPATGWGRWPLRPPPAWSPAPPASRPRSGSWEGYWCWPRQPWYAGQAEAQPSAGSPDGSDQALCSIVALRRALALSIWAAMAAMAAARSPRSIASKIGTWSL